MHPKPNAVHLAPHLLILIREIAQHGEINSDSTRGYFQTDTEGGIFR